MNSHIQAKRIVSFLFALSLLLTAPGSPSLPAAEAAVSVPDSFADLAEKMGPAVVNIYTTQTIKGPLLPYNFFFHGDERFQEFFKHFFDAPNGQAPQREMKRTSLGSGVIISEDGYIITNNHVIEDADEINVRIANHEEYEAKIIGRDPKTDIALIKIKPKSPLPSVEFGDSDKLRVGDWVVAIGNPFGFEQTVTAGIVSGKGRSLGSSTYENFIQTDASINPGNSGGPLFDLNWKMIGINTAIYSRSGGNIGIGFAIPVNMAKNIITQLREHGSVVRGWLGVMIQHVTPDLANRFGLERPIGALVGEVNAESPAEKAGIQPGDIIIEYNGKEISQMSQLPTMVAQTPIDTKAILTIIRNGKKKRITVTIGKLDESQTASKEAGEETEQELGMTVQELTPELARSLNIVKKAGLVITGVEPASNAAEAGLRPGDLILEINRTPVRTIREYQNILSKAKKGENILFLTKRGRHSRFVVVRTD